MYLCIYKDIIRGGIEMYEYNEMIDRLKNFIDERKISIKQLSELADVPYRNLYRHLARKPTCL